MRGAIGERMGGKRFVERRREDEEKRDSSAGGFVVNRSTRSFVETIKTWFDNDEASSRRVVFWPPSIRETAVSAPNVEVSYCKPVMSVSPSKQLR